MLTRKSGILALVVGAAVLGACEKKDGDIIIEPQPTPVTLTIAPKPVPTLNNGQTVQLVAVVTGTTNTAVTWSVLSGNSASVSPTGLVTAHATNTGVTTIQAVSQADPNAKDVVTVTVQASTPGGGGATQITIGSITQFATNLPVNPGNVFGLIDITANLDVPAGTSGSLRIDIVDQAGNVVRGDVCSQTFTSGSSGADASVEALIPVTVVCTFNTAQLDSAGLALLQNGTYRIRARVLNASGTQLAAASSQPLVFNNADMLVMVVRTDSMAGPQQDQAGLSWRAGNVVVHIRPAIYSTTQAAPLGAITSMNINLSTSGPGTSWNSTASCLADNDTDGTSDAVDPTPACPVVTSTVAAARIGATNLWRAVFPTSSTIGTAGSGGVEDRAGLVVAPSGVVTVSGNSFPICSAAQAAVGACVQTFAVNFPSVTAGTVPVPITAQNPLRVDNLAPRVTSFNVTGAFLGCGSVTCYANANFAFAQGTITAGVAAQSAASTAGFTNVDFGVDRQTSNFAVGTSAQFTAGSGFATGVTTMGAISPALSETTLSTACPANAPNCIQPYVARVTVVDALGNDTILFAGNTGAATLTLASAQTLGLDLTRPVVTSVAFTGAKTYARNSVDQDDQPMTVTVTFRDTASTLNAGPSGFPTNPLTGSVTLWNAANPGGVAAPGVGASSCFAVNAVTSSCTFTVADAAPVGTNPSGYYEIRSRVADVTVPGGNVSATDTTFYLDDETPPNVAGVVAPSSIPAGQPTTFTADMNDDVELGDLLASVGYNQGYFAHLPASCTGGALTCGVRVGLATYGLPLTSALVGAGVTYNPFIWSLESVTGADTPFGDQAFAQAINFAVRDMAGMTLRAPCPVPPTDNATLGVDSLADGSTDGWCRQRQNNNVAVNIAFANTLPGSFTTITPAMVSFRIDSTSNNATVSSNSAAPTGGTVTIRAEARGPQGTFANPFSQVNFYVYDTTLQRWLQLPGTPTVLASDADVIGFRVWRYTLIVPATSWPVENTCRLSAPASPCVQSIQGSQIRAIGVNGGRGLLSNPAILGAP